MGCFWHPDAIFSKIPGIIEATVGYTGGTKEHPTYEDVCTGKTGHAEAVEVTYDPKKISYDELLDIFWKNHNPTTPGRQGITISLRNFLSHIGTRSGRPSLKREARAERAVWRPNCNRDRSRGYFLARGGVSSAVLRQEKHRPRSEPPKNLNSPYFGVMGVKLS